MSDIRNKLRSAALKSPERKRVEINYNGEVFELLAPLVHERKEILRKAKIGDGKDPTILDMSEWVAIICTVIPGTTEKVFDETDIEAFRNMGMGGFVDKVSAKAPLLLGFASEEEKKPEGENSLTTGKID